MTEPRNIDAPVTDGDIEALFETMLARPVGDDEYKRDLIARGYTLQDLLAVLLQSEEFRIKQQRRIDAERWGRRPSIARVPQELSVTPLEIGRVLIVGSCLSELWAERIAAPPISCGCDFYWLLNLPEAPERPIQAYDFQLIQLPLRRILPDASFVRTGEADAAGYERLLERSLKTMRMWLTDAMRWNVAHGLLTIVFPFIVPQLNYMGRLMPRYELSNPVYFVEKLNEALVQEIKNYSNTYLLELNEIIASYGRVHIQEDLIAAFNHGSLLSDFDAVYDGGRLEPALRASDLNEFRTTETILAAWQEIVAIVRTVRQIDTVKLVAVDLDDTLWRGTIAEVEPADMATSEGWPKGFWEALAFLKRRGVLLAILSRNEESRVLEVWDRILSRYLRLEDFAIRRINWRPKSKNMAEILEYTNLLPRNVVFIDDNPTQRSEVQAAFPEIRVLGGTPSTWRRLLLAAAETQVPTITPESAARTDMVRAQVTREESRKSLSRESFLESLNVRIAFFEVSSVAHARFGRVLELINKTNQFNTTGKRWTTEECTAAFAEGTRLFAFDIADTYTEYGLVGVLIVDRTRIRQFVMSCRIMGLDAEIAAVAQMVRLIRDGGGSAVFADLVATERNLPCRDVYRRCGFEAAEGGWMLAAEVELAIPAHIELTHPRPELQVYHEHSL